MFSVTCFRICTKMIHAWLEPVNRIGWGSSGGEQAASSIENSLVVDGIHNVISVLEEIELGRLGDIDFIEAQACPGSCVGGILNVNNRFVAGVRLRH